MNNLLTAIIFTYNHKDTIAKCIESILNQKTKYPYIISIWDDCSIDGTSDICREYAKKYPEKIKLTVQKENTFLKKDLEHQPYAAISSIDTKYFCIIDGDDYWCDENKIEIALDFLENHDNFVGFAHDTLQVDKFNGTEFSYIHNLIKWKPKEIVNFEVDAPFFLTSSRIFRNFNYKDLKILPIDYLLYYYHFSKGPIYYYDKIMAVYTISKRSTFASGNQNIKELNSMFAFKVSKMFNFQLDEFTTALQKKYDTSNGLGDKRYKKLCFFKKLFGKKYGWYIWFILTFVLRYGFKCMNTNYIYSRKKAKKLADETDINKFKIQKKKLETKIDKQKKLSSLIIFITSNIPINKQIYNYLIESLNHKKERIIKLEKELNLLQNDGSIK